MYMWVCGRPTTEGATHGNSQARSIRRCWLTTPVCGRVEREREGEERMGGTV